MPFLVMSLVFQKIKTAPMPFFIRPIAKGIADQVMKAFVEPNVSNNLRYVDVKPEAQERYNDEMQKRLQNSVWQTGCSSWYVNEFGRNTANWPGFTFEYRLRTRQPNWTHFDLATA